MTILEKTRSKNRAHNSKNKTAKSKIHEKFRKSLNLNKTKSVMDKKPRIEKAQFLQKRFSEQSAPRLRSAEEKVIIYCSNKFVKSFHEKYDGFFGSVRFSWDRAWGTYPQNLQDEQKQCKEDNKNTFKDDTLESVGPSMWI